jgi:S-DNA-T family DNA segregation ATPase FtsK/SpoIIIE
MTAAVGTLGKAAGVATGEPGADGHGGLVLLGLLAVAVVVLVVVSGWLRGSYPWVWWPLFGAALTVARLAWSWRAGCEGAGLSVPARRFSRYGVIHGSARGRRRGGGLVVRGEPLRMIAPRRVGLRVGACGLTVTVRLHPSQVPGDYERAAEGFAHTWRVHAVRVASPRPGFVRLTAVGFDPLRYPHPRRTFTAPDPAAVGSGVLAVPVGGAEDGTAWLVDLRARAHWLVTGATRSGKSTLTARVLCGLASRPVALVGIDAKGGMELGPFRPRLTVLATTRGEAVGVIDALTAELADRMRVCAAAGARNIWELPSGVRPTPVVVVVDEIAELFLHADRAGKDEAARCVTGLVRLAQLGAALGVHLWVAGQRFGSELGAGATLLRAQLLGRVCHRVADTETAVMTLAGLPDTATEAALRIPADLPGVAVVGDDSGAWGLARSHPLAEGEAEAAAAAWAHLRVPMPGVEAAVPADGGGRRWCRCGWSTASTGTAPGGGPGRGRSGVAGDGADHPRCPGLRDGHGHLLAGVRAARRARAGGGVVRVLPGRDFGRSRDPRRGGGGVRVGVRLAPVTAGREKGKALRSKGKRIHAARRGHGGIGDRLMGFADLDCPECGGSGERETGYGKYRRCRRCHGTGVL